jgi:uncharacterized membrane protein
VGRGAYRSDLMPRRNRKNQIKEENLYMDFFERILTTMIYGKRELYWGDAAIAMIFFVLCNIGVVIYGLVSGYWQWCIVGGILAVFCAILAVIFIILNIRKNSNRW